MPASIHASLPHPLRCDLAGRRPGDHIRPLRARFLRPFVGGGMDGVVRLRRLVWGQPNILWANLTWRFSLPVVIVSVERRSGRSRTSRSQRPWAPRSGRPSGSGAERRHRHPDRQDPAVSRSAGGWRRFLPVLHISSGSHLTLDQFMGSYHVYIMSTQCPTSGDDGDPVRDHPRPADADVRPEFSAIISAIKCVNENYPEGRVANARIK